MKNYLLISFLVFGSSKVFAENFKCFLNLMPPGKEISLDDAGKYIKRFDYKAPNNGKGKSVKLDGRTVFLWNKGGWHHLVVKKEPTGKNDKGIDIGGFEIKTKYPESIKEILFQLSSTEKLKCLTEKMAGTIVDAQDKFLFFGASSLGSEVAHRGKWEVKTLINLVIFYRQINVNDKMRPVIFQDGMQVTADAKINRKKEFCQFQVKVKYDDNIDISRGTKFTVSNVDEFKQGGNSKIISYNFVDFGSGRSSYQGDATYEPFVLECKVDEKHAWVPSDLRRITSGAMSVSRVK